MLTTAFLLKEYGDFPPGEKNGSFVSGMVYTSMQLLCKLSENISD